MTSSQKLIISVGIISLLALLPFPTTTCPEWTLQILASNGKPYPHANATQHWQYYSVEHHDHYEDACADNSGTVTFPKRTFTASIAQRALGGILEVLQVGVHSSFGSHSYVIASGAGYDNHLVSYTGGEPPKSVQLTTKSDHEFLYRKVCK
jgi:hypothetical protein